MDIKQKWNVAFEKHLRVLDSRKPVIWGGDFNCILQQNGGLWGLWPPISAGVDDCLPSNLFADLDNKALPYWDRMSGLSKTEREEFNNILNPTDDESRKFVDVWRHLHPDATEYTSVTTQTSSQGHLAQILLS
jgi:AP endonuclease 1